MPLKVSDGMGAWVDDFKKSDAPQFKGKSDKERRDMALAAYLSAKRGDKNEDTSDAVKAFLAKGGKIKKLPPAKAQGYHGKDDPGKGMHGMLDKPDTKKIGTRKKAKSMEGVEEARAPRMKYALIGAKDMKIYSTGSDERDLKLDRRSLEKRFNQPLKLARLKTAQRIGDKVDKSQIKEAKRTVTINKPDRLTSMRVSKDKPPFDNPKPMQKDTKDKFGNPIKNRAKHLARKAAKDLLNKAK